MKTIKKLFIFPALIAVGCSSSDERVKTRIDEVLKPLPSLLAADPTGDSAQIHLNKKWLPANTFQPYFYESPETLYQKSWQRDERVEKIEQWMAPYEKSLIDVLVASKNQSGTPNAAAGYLQFAAPTEKLRTDLLSVARDPSSLSQNASRAYESIFLLNLADQEVTDEVIGLIKDRDQKQLRSPIGADLLGDAARWACPEMREIYLGFLSIPYKPENYPAFGGEVKLRANYEHALAGLLAFGKLDSLSVSLMKARFDEIPLEKDRDLHRHFIDSIAVAEGRAAPSPAVNLKGQLLGASKKIYTDWLASSTASKSIDSAKPDKTALIEKNPSATKTTSSEGKSESGDSNEVILKVVLSVFFLVIITAFFLLRKLPKKSRS